MLGFSTMERGNRVVGREVNQPTFQLTQSWGPIADTLTKLPRLQPGFPPLPLLGCTSGPTLTPFLPTRNSWVRSDDNNCLSAAIPGN